MTINVLVWRGQIKTFIYMSSITERHACRVPSCRIGVLAFICGECARMRAAGRFGTARNYDKALRSFSAFLGGRDIRFSQLTVALVGEYNTFLVRRGMVRNSISFYMRIMRAVYNKAVRQGVARLPHPFAEVYTGIDSTRKRAVPEAIVADLCRLPIDDNQGLALARDMFVFSFCARGMAFVDMAYLRKSDVENGVLRYVRRKTGQLMTVRMEECASRIIERYSANAGEHVFPILSDEDEGNAYEQYYSALNVYNRRLATLSRMLGISCRLTSYTARHSWATVARNRNVPVSVISAGMGHTTEQTTRIYIASLENSVIDDANREVLAFLE